MNLYSLLYGVGAAGLFSSRVFLPAFLTALMLRFGGHFPIIEHMGIINHVTHAPAWFTSDPSLFVLGILAGLEVFGQKNPEVRRVMQEFDIYLKPALAALTTLGVINATDANFIGSNVHAGVGDTLSVLISAVFTWRAALLRKQVMTAVFDHLDGTKLDHLISWLEELWVAFGLLLLFVFPFLMLLTILAALGVMLLIRKRLEVLEEHTRVQCGHCGVLIYSCAIACPTCRTGVGQPNAVGFLGQTKLYPTEDPANHPYRLFEKRRCSVCATRLAAGKMFEPCPACGTVALANEKFVQGYLAYVGGRLPIVLGVCFLMGLVPILGLIVGVIYFRVELVLPFSQYLPIGKRFLLRIGLSLLFLAMAILQIVPVVGGLSVAVMALISYTAYRNSFESALRETPRAGVVPA